MKKSDLKDSAIINAGSLALGAAAGALSKRTITPSPSTRGAFAAQIGSAVGVAAANGAGIGGSLAAGATVVTAKAAAAVAAGAAALPYVAAAAAGYGLYKLIKKL